MLSRITIVFSCIFLVLAVQLHAHTDTFLEFKDKNLVGLPPEYLPATLDLDKGLLRIASGELEFPPFLKGIFNDPTRHSLKISSSWYHDPEGLPPYINIMVTPKGRDFTYTILIDMKKMLIIEVGLELKESDSLTRLVPIDPNCWKNSEGSGTIEILK
ncbi:MAG: hypothetical protein WC765_07645 [Phycisphaerae bacterium]|jgi:hypothetical protein